MSSARFADKVVLVTGASDRGIGGAIVERVAREGGIVCIASRTEPRRLRKLLFSAWSSFRVARFRGLARSRARLSATRIRRLQSSFSRSDASPTRRHRPLRERT